ncbi:hypothetical protein OG875_14715 [Streptomyces sp. NBC_01498]|uniref:hypothetical protein n=1 Tax=Streptomyces sp. NBC_01498 TaxID=2975870 RepID=UPI002E7B7C4A|nr:hypothetical protein [Streptomyces sp. NBC_01498]WTL25742.1 hypothetical protein OG875_14715 [Streptomyces sp. NBC_01498]
MAPRPRELSPERSARDPFGSEMRRCREEAGMSLESLAAVVIYEESISPGTLMEEKRLVRPRRRAYDLLRASALSPKETAKYIRAVMKALPS